MRRRDPKDLAIQQAMLKNPETLGKEETIVPSPNWEAQFERGIMALHRRDVEKYHEQRGTRHVHVHSPLAAKAKFEVPYYFEARRLEAIVEGKKPTIARDVKRGWTALWRMAWIRFKAWMKQYMPLSYKNFNLEKLGAHYA